MGQLWNWNYDLLLVPAVVWPSYLIDTYLAFSPNSLIRPFCRDPIHSTDNSALVGRANVKVQVLDVNDNLPELLGSHEVQVCESAVPGQVCSSTANTIAHLAHTSRLFVKPMVLSILLHSTTQFACLHLIHTHTLLTFPYAWYTLYLHHAP